MVHCRRRLGAAAVVFRWFRFLSPSRVVPALLNCLDSFAAVEAPRAFSATASASQPWLLLLPPTAALSLFRVRGVPSTARRDSRAAVRPCVTSSPRLHSPTACTSCSSSSGGSFRPPRGCPRCPSAGAVLRGSASPFRRPGSSPAPAPLPGPGCLFAVVVSRLSPTVVVWWFLRVVTVVALFPALRILAIRRCCRDPTGVNLRVDPDVCTCTTCTSCTGTRFACQFRQLLRLLHYVHVHALERARLFAFPQGKMLGERAPTGGRSPF